MSKWLTYTFTTSARNCCLHAWYKYPCKRVIKHTLIRKQLEHEVNSTMDSNMSYLQLREHNAERGLRKNMRDNRRVFYKTDMELVNRFELFLLDEGQQKVEEKAETRKSKSPEYFVTWAHPH